MRTVVILTALLVATAGITILTPTAAACDSTDIQCVDLCEEGTVCIVACSSLLVNRFFDGCAEVNA